MSLVLKALPDGNVALVRAGPLLHQPTPSDRAVTPESRFQACWFLTAAGERNGPVEQCRMLSKTKVLRLKTPVSLPLGQDRDCLGVAYAKCPPYIPKQHRCARVSCPLSSCAPVMLSFIDVSPLRHEVCIFPSAGSCWSPVVVSPCSSAVDLRSYVSASFEEPKERM